MENLLSIVILFCDKDYQYVPSLLQQLNTKVMCNFQLVLIDNREKCINERLDVSEFFSNHQSCVYFQFGKNAAQLAAKKKALSLCKGNYVWFFDGDDDFADAVSNNMLNRCKEDIIVFNYGFCQDNASSIDDDIIYIETFEGSKQKRLFNFQKSLDFFYKKIGCTCWNKWFKKSLLEKFFNLIDENKKVSCNEDVWISLVAYHYAKTIRLDEHFIYMNRPNRGISNSKKITSVEDFVLLAQGAYDILSLFSQIFSDKSKLYNKDDKLNEIINFLNARLQVCDDSIKSDVISNVYSRTKLMIGEKNG